jgi:hypothetical protein
MENIDLITYKDKINILANCGTFDGIILAFEKIYSIMEHKNFHKRNMNKDTITFINGKYNIEVYNDHDFKKYLINNIIFLIKRIFFQCMNTLTTDCQYNVWKNITHIEHTITTCNNDNEIIKKISNMICVNNENTTIKRMFNNFKKNIIDETNKTALLNSNQLSDINTQIKLYNKSLYTINPNINLEYLKQNIWTKHNNEDEDLNNDLNNINIIHINDTLRYKYYLEIKKLEFMFMNTLDNTTIGDINEFIKLHNERAFKELNELTNFFSPPEHIYNDIYNKLIKEPTQLSTKNLLSLQH